MLADDESDLEGNRLCCGCVKDTYLSKLIFQKGETAVCSYCGDTEKTFSIQNIAAQVDKAFDVFFDQTRSYPDPMEDAMGDWERSGEPVLVAIQNATGMPEAAAEDVRHLLADEHYEEDAREPPFDKDAYYEEILPGAERWTSEWNQFETALRTEARYFNRSAEKLLHSIFSGVERWKTRAGASVVVAAGPDTDHAALFRARVFQSDDKLKAALGRLDLELGSPSHLNAMPGRMNPRGVSVFYGATEESIAVAEVRPPVKSRVLVGRFIITRSMRLLDLAALTEMYEDGSMFDPAHIADLERTNFLNTLEQRITRPVMPSDEGLDYLVTQAVADFLANGLEPPLDGIIYKSVQKEGDGRNVVLFHKVAKVARLDRPDGTEVNVSLGHYEDGERVEEFEVIESVPEEKADKSAPSFEELIFKMTQHLDNIDEDLREPTLLLDAKHVFVHTVNWVDFDTTPEKVAFRRWIDRKDSPF